MALYVEKVIDSRMDSEESLCGSGRFEPLHLSLSTPQAFDKLAPVQEAFDAG